MSVLVLFLFLLYARDTILAPSRIDVSNNEIKAKHKTYLIVGDPSRSSMNEPVKLDGNQMMEKGMIKWKAKSRSNGRSISK